MLEKFLFIHGNVSLISENKVNGKLIGVYLTAPHHIYFTLYFLDKFYFSCSSTLIAAYRKYSVNTENLKYANVLQENVQNTPSSVIER